MLLIGTLPFQRYYTSVHYQPSVAHATTKNASIVDGANVSDFGATGSLDNASLSDMF